MAMTIEQQRALALAQARLRAQQQSQAAQGAMPFSEARDAGVIRQDPGNEDLWAPALPQAEPEPVTPQNVLGAINDQMTGLSTGAAQGLTFGFADEIAAGAATPLRMAMDRTWNAPAAYGAALDDIRAEEQGIAERAPVTYALGNIGGAVGTGMGLAQSGYSLMAGAKPTTTSMGLRGATEGALYGGLHGLGSGDTMDERLGLALDGALTGGAMGGALGAGAGYLANRAAVNAAPSVGDLRAQAGALYDQARSSGMTFSQSTVQQAADDIAARAISEGLDETLHPGAAAALRRLQTSAQTGMTAQEAQTMRRVLSAAAQSPTNPDQARIARTMIEMFDDQITGSIPSLASANATYATARKGQLFEDAFTRARDRLGVNYNNAGMVTALRREFNRILQSPKLIRGFSEAEREAIRGFVRGGPMENFMRAVGRLAPTGPISGATAFGVPASMGYMLGNPVAGAALGAGAAGTGVAARGMGNAMAMSHANRIAAMIRGGGAPTLSPARQAVVDALIAGQAAEAPRIPQNTQAAIRALIAGTSP